MQRAPDSLDEVFAALTDKQRETIELLSDGRTSKEIAYQLDISESAAVQRIETLRAKTGGLLRKDLAREWRAHRERIAHDGEHTCKDLTGKKFQLPEPEPYPQDETRSHQTDDMMLADAMPFEASAPWAYQSEPKVVPEVLDGDNASLNRWLASLGIAIAMVVLLLVLLAVAGALGELV